MDDALAQKMKDLSGNCGESKENSVSFRVNDDEGSIELVIGERKEEYRLRPLQELYGMGAGISVNAKDDTFLPLLLCIEEEIARFDAIRGPLTDAAVLRAMQCLSANPEEPSNDALVRAIQMGLRLNLSLNDYSRQEVRQAVRKIGKSVERHQDGQCGYLRFIHKFFARFLGADRKAR